MAVAVELLFFSDLPIIKFPTTAASAAAVAARCLAKLRAEKQVAEAEKLL